MVAKQRVRARGFRACCGTGAADGGWRVLLACVKARYAADAWVAAIVRRPAEVPPLPSGIRWGGAASWEGLRTTLRDLRLPGEDLHIWRRLMDVLEQDGDLAAFRAVSRESATAGSLLEEAAPYVLEHFIVRLARRARVRRAAFRSQIRHRVLLPTPRDPWAGLGIEQHDGTWMWFALRGVFSAAPETRVWFYPSPTRASERAARRAADTLRARGLHYQPRSDGVLSPSCSWPLPRRTVLLYRAQPRKYVHELPGEPRDGLRRRSRLRRPHASSFRLEAVSKRLGRGVEGRGESGSWGT